MDKNRYTIRRAESGDVPEIMKFINDYWKEGHILSKNRELFEYEFLKSNGDFNFIIAIDNNVKEIIGTYGFMFSSNVENKKDIWGSIWKVREEYRRVEGLGVRLYEKADEYSKCRFHLGTGVNPKTAGIVQALILKKKVKRMNHYYILNPKCETYKIADIKESKINTIKRPNHNDIKIKEVRELEELKKIEIINQDSIPYKDGEYIYNRYIEHPVYRYEVLGAYDIMEQLQSLMVYRKVKQSEHYAIRIVDLIGNSEALKDFVNHISSHFSDENCEYIDMYNWGLNENFASNAGFSKKFKNDINIIPNYFEPFVRENTEIHISYNEEGTMFFKGDGDQDRPNLL